MATTMAANTSATACSTHYPSDLVNRTDSSMELTKRFAHMQLKSVAQVNCTPKRQPTIVCEDIADDVSGGASCDPAERLRAQSLLLRTSSSASLSVPVVCENEVTEKRRPPLPERVFH